MVRQAVNYLRGAASSVTLVGLAVVVAALIVVSVGTGAGPIGLFGHGDPGGDPVVLHAAATEAERAGETERVGDRPRGAVSGAGERADRPERRKRKRRRNHGAGDDSGDHLPAGRPPSSPAESSPRPASGGDAPGAPTAPGSRGVGGNGSISNPVNPPPVGSGGGWSAPVASGAGGGGRKNGNTLTAGLNEGIGGTVDTLDKALGGTLGETGLSDTVKGVTETAIGPESTLGKTVDRVVGGLGRLLGGK